MLYRRSRKTNPAQIGIEEDSVEETGSVTAKKRNSTR
jgi:hypothetical protein